MNFDFSEDQKLFKAQVARFLADKCPLTVARRVLDGEESHASEVWKGLADLGALGVAIPEAHGGLGLGMLELCVIAEEVGRACAPVPFTSSICLAGEAIRRFGSEAQKQAWLPRIANGEAIGTLAVSEGPHGTPAAKVAATLTGDKLTGVKVPVADGEAAHVAIVLAQGGTGPTLALVDLAQDGVARKRVQTVDPTCKHAELSFDGAKAEALGGRGEGLALLKGLHDVAAVLIAFEQIGGAEAALMMARDFALERYAFGRPIASYQAIKHKLADAYIKIELARSNAFYGAMMLASDGADLALAAATSRVAATEAYDYSAKENIQTHGGIGFTWEANTQFHYRRSRYLALTIGGQTHWRNKLVSELEKRNAA